MRRRDFIKVVLGSAIAWPFAVRAQQPALVVGFLASRSPEDSASVLPIFRNGLKEAGYVEGQDVAIEYQWARGNYDLLPTLAAELINRKAAVIAAFGPPAALAAKSATTTVPIVFVTGGDPVVIGLVNSLSQPGGNITGVNLLISEVGSKRIGILAELLPRTAIVGFLVNPKNPDTEIETGDALAGARALGWQGFIVNASSEQEFEAAFTKLVQRRAGALYVSADPSFNSRRTKIVSLAARHNLPAIYPVREFVEAGGLVSYGANLADAYQQAGNYVGRILKGAKPADLPVLQPTNLELVLNLKTAKTLGLDVPATLLARADKVIE